MVDAHQFIMTAENTSRTYCQWLFAIYVDEIKQMKPALELSHTEYENLSQKRTQYTQNRIFKAYNLVWTYYAHSLQRG